ncbi:MAG: hypothetical protein KGP12_10065 [Actinomycetales bacterium]|nr:hypothetical protein [Actinomycetales bacterium]
MDTWADPGRLRASLNSPVLADALAGARADIDALLWRRDVRSAAAAVAAASIDRGGRASAAIDGADVFDADDSPMGRLLARAWAVTSTAAKEASTWERAPLQVLAHLHAVAAAGFQDADALGRPRSAEEADDPLRIGVPAPVEALSPRLVALASLMVRSTDLPGIAMAAIAHHEVMALRPFGWGSGLVARALTRCVLASRGLDPSCFSIPEAGMLEQGRVAYVRAMRRYLDGTTEGLVDSLIWFCASIGLGARAVQVPSA